MSAVVLLWLALASSPPSSAAPPQCRADRDCVLSTFTGCCPACCPPAPHAVPRGTREGEKCRFLDLQCPDCAAAKCRMGPPKDLFVATCRAGRCVAERRCAQDRDCAVFEVTPPPDAACHASPCGCCPVAAAGLALTDDEGGLFVADAPPATTTKAPTTAVPKVATDPLPPGPQGPTPPACSPCPPPPPARAACVQHRCVLRPTTTPSP